MIQKLNISAKGRTEHKLHHELNEAAKNRGAHNLSTPAGHYL